VLLDTNIVIHACRPGGEWLAPWTESPEAAIASVTKIEALGFTSIKPDEELAIQELFATCVLHALDDAVVDRAILVRRGAKIRAMDAIIAATALEHGLTLVTQNVNDFKGVTGLCILNPFEQGEKA
jgi:predicted nucleic acid-binding protein